MNLFYTYFKQFSSSISDITNFEPSNEKSKSCGGSNIVDQWKALFFSSIFILFLLSSCGKISADGNIETKQINLEQFENLTLEGNFRVFYIKSAKNFLTIETYSNIAENVKVKIKDKTLIISEKRPTEGVEFYDVNIYSKYDLKEITVNKLAELNLSSEIKTDYFKLNLNNNAKFIGSVQSRRTDLEMDEMSRANFTGRSEKVYLKMKDTANLIAPYWRIKDLKIETKNQPYAEVTVQDSITGTLEDTSKFLYYNDPIRAFKNGKNTKVNNQILK